MTQASRLGGGGGSSLELETLKCELGSGCVTLKAQRNRPLWPHIRTSKRDYIWNTWALSLCSA